MTAALVHTVRVVCAWCRTEWRKPWDAEDDGKPSHSICDACSAAMFATHDREDGR